MKSLIEVIVSKLMNYRAAVYPLPSLIASRSLWEYLTVIFNRVDTKRRKELGADRTCAEWVLRNGGSVKFLEIQNYVRNYNNLPAENTQLRVKAIDATDSAISHHGFAHMEGCDSLDRIILHNCPYIYDEAMRLLLPIEKHLRHLQVSKCPKITANGLIHVGNLKNLQTLSISQLPNVNQLDQITKELQTQLPNCRVDNSCPASPAGTEL